MDSSEQIPVIEGSIEPRKLLKEFAENEKSSNKNNSIYKENEVFNVGEIAFAETARWALCGMKNLTKPPSRDSYVSEKLLECNVLPVLLHILNVQVQGIQVNQDENGHDIETE